MEQMAALEMDNAFSQRTGRWSKQLAFVFCQAAWYCSSFH